MATVTYLKTQSSKPRTRTDDISRPSARQKLAKIVETDLSGRQEAMKDKSLGIFLVVLFGISGIAILILAWLQPMMTSERILTTFIGLGGLFIALTRTWLFKSHRQRKGSIQTRD